MLKTPPPGSHPLKKIPPAKSTINRTDTANTKNSDKAQKKKTKISSGISSFSALTPAKDSTDIYSGGFGANINSDNTRSNDKEIVSVDELYYSRHFYNQESKDDTTHSMDKSDEDSSQSFVADTSMLPDQDLALPPDQMQRFNEDPLPEAWASRMEEHAGRTHESLFAGSHQKPILALKNDLNTAGWCLRSMGIERPQVEYEVLTVSDIGRALNAFLTGPYTAERHIPDGTGFLRLGHMANTVLKQFIGGPAQPQNAGNILKAIRMLPQEQSLLLMQADLLQGGGLMEALRLGGEATNDGKIKELFSELGALRALASTHNQINEKDKTGTVSEQLAIFFKYANSRGVSYYTKTLLSFSNHLNFQIRLGDFKMPNTSAPGWRESMIFDLFGRFAALPESTSEEISRLIRMPKPYMLSLLSHICANKLEGDVHILRLLKDDRSLLQTHFKEDPDRTAYDAILRGLDSGGYDHALFAECVKGKKLPITDIKAKLDEKLEKDAADQCNRINKDLGARIDRVDKAIKRQKPEGAESSKKLLVDLKNMERFLGKFRNFCVTKDQVKQLIMRFGADKVSKFSFSGVKENYDKDNGLYLRKMDDQFKQLDVQIKGLEDPDFLRKGLRDLAPVMPTAGKKLEDFHHVDSMVRSMVEVASEISKHDVFADDTLLGRTPIIIIDQSDGSGNIELWNINEMYLKGLNEKYKDVGLNIVHVSMKQVRSMIDQSGLEKMFDTTRSDYAGYGGARNMAFLLGPVIRHFVLKDTPLDEINGENLLGNIHEHALNKHAPKIFMGDDTDYVSPGTMFAKVGINAVHADDYYCAVSQRDGRDTTGVSPRNAVNGLPNLHTTGVDAFIEAFGNSRFSRTERKPGMGSVTGGPRFCFDIPHGGEEKHHDALKAYVDQFSSVRHLSGDRMSSYASQVKHYLDYAIGTEMYKTFGSDKPASWHEENLQSLADGRGGFTCLGEVLEYAVSPNVQERNSRGVIIKMAQWLFKDGDISGSRAVGDRDLKMLKSYQAESKEIDPAGRRELEQILVSLENVCRQNSIIETAVKQFLQQVTPSLFGDDVEKPDYRRIKDAVKAADLTDVHKTLNTTMDKVFQDIDLADRNNRIIRDTKLLFDSLLGGFESLAKRLLANPL